MKKLLLASVAVSGLALAAAPAHAEVNLELGGYFKGYGAFVNQDETTGTDVNSFDLLRDTELHFTGETTLDNGLTVGAHAEFQVDGDDGTATADESYAYFSGSWGRVNFGNEDGAAFLLQVAAPSADSNIDGIRQYIQPFANTGGMGNLSGTGTQLDYDMDISAKADKLTYLSPIMSGFQVGVSYSPEVGDTVTDTSGVGSSTTAGTTYQETYEVSARYEGQVQNVGVIVGAGYARRNRDNTTALLGDNTAWNVGLNLGFGPFGVGVAYVADDLGLDGANEADRDTLVVGLDYTTGAFKVGASYYNQDNDNGIEYDRYTAGVTYEYGPGMTFRGSIQQVEVDNVTGTADADGTALLLGTQVNF